MPLMISWLIHGGQTGVDRGAWAAATALYQTTGQTIRAGGIMPKDAKDERGVIPEIVRRNMRACDTTGYEARTAENVAGAHALLVVVQNRLFPDATPGTRLTLELAAKRPGFQVMIADGDSADQVTWWLTHLPPWTRNKHPFKLMVAGPRESKWPGAELITQELLIKALVRSPL